MPLDLKNPNSKSSASEIRFFLKDRDRKIRKAHAQIKRWFNQSQAAEKLLEKKLKRRG